MGGGSEFVVLVDLGRNKVFCDGSFTTGFLGFFFPPPVKLSIAIFSKIPTGTSKAMLRKNAQK